MVTARRIAASLWASVRISDLIAGWAVAVVAAALPAHAAPPERVVSMNLCTDQLAMLMAAPGQLISVSNLASDPRMSAMADQAADYVPNHGRAEEIYLMRPDLVIAGQFTSGPTVAMLKRLGVRVEILPPASDFQAIRDHIAQIGQWLDREERATEVADQFDTRLAALSTGAARGRAALYYANSYTSGRSTLAGAVVEAAGYDNIATDYGIETTTVLPLELLVMARPDRLITGGKWPGRSRSEAILDHPALIATTEAPAEITDSDWVCGTPAVLDAIEALK